MNTKQKHAEFIKAWLDGREVEAYTTVGWSKVSHLLAFTNFGLFRFARPKWQQDLLDAVKDGKVVEYWNHNGWVSSLINDISNIDNYVFQVQPLYRIKPEPKPDVVQYMTARANHYCPCHDERMESSNIKIVFDCETGKPKSVMILD